MGLKMIKNDLVKQDILLRDLKEILLRHGYSENGSEIGDNFSTYGFIGEYKLYLKFKLL
jgi:hypothetical protein